MGSVRTRMVRPTTTTVLLLLLQAAAYRQASVPTHANTVLTDAAVSLKESLALDYDVLPMFKDITFMMESLVELMPYLEEAERPVITKAYEYLLNLESSLSLDFRTTLGLLKDKATKYGGYAEQDPEISKETEIQSEDFEEFFGPSLNKYGQSCG